MQSHSTDTTSAGSRATVMRPDRVDAVVVGGGHAGLAIGFHVARQGRRFVILEASASRFLPTLRLHPRAMPALAPH